MNLTKIFRIAAICLAAAAVFLPPAHAATSVFFSAGTGCTGTSSASFSPGGAPVQVSLCMTTTAPTATCGHTIVLQSAVNESGRFFAAAPVTLGSNYSDPNNEVSLLPLAINNPPTVADFGGTSSAPVAAAANQLLATFNLTPQSSATASSYSISLNSVSSVAVDADGTCGATTAPTDTPIAATFALNSSPVPVFTSAASTTFAINAPNTFNVTASGAATITFSATGLPAAVSLSPSGVLSGTPTAAGTFQVAITASNNSSATQNFTLTVATQANQSITFVNPGARTFSSSIIALTASATSSLAVTFTSITPAVCTVFNSNVTMVGLGTCTIAANQGGNGTYLAAPQILQSFGVLGEVPGAPTIGTATAGTAQASIAFTPPASSGGSVITSYSVSCNGISQTGNVSPITVTGLTNGVVYTCAVTATNSLGTGPASATVTVTPAVTALSLVSVVSRKVHGTEGTFSLPLVTGVPIAGAITVESRVPGTAGHVIAFQFNGAITTPGTVSAVDGASAAVANTATFAGNEVIVTLTGVLDRTRVTVTLANVNGTGTGTTFSVSLGFLAGDQNGTYTVDGGDIGAIRSRSGQAATAVNFRGDFNASGTIDGGDISVVRARSGNSLP